MAIPVDRLEQLARMRLADAEALGAANQLDGAFYLCGYAVELALKARICKTLKWSGYPETAKELKIFRAFQSHHLDMLLSLTGCEGEIRDGALPQWSVITKRWSPEMRYEAPSVTSEELSDAIAAATDLVGRLL